MGAHKVAIDSDTQISMSQWKIPQRAMTSLAQLTLSEIDLECGSPQQHNGWPKQLHDVLDLRVNKVSNRFGQVE
jgi:hypothetical protein